MPQILFESIYSTFYYFNYSANLMKGGGKEGRKGKYEEGMVERKKEVRERRRKEKVKSLHDRRGGTQLDPVSLSLETQVRRNHCISHLI